MPEDFERCVSKVKAQGKTESQAFAICTSTFKKNDSNSFTTSATFELRMSLTFSLNVTPITNTFIRFKDLS